MSRVVVTFLTVPNMDINLFDDASDSVDTIVYILSDITNFLGLLPRCCGLWGCSRGWGGQRSLGRQDGWC